MTEHDNAAPQITRVRHGLATNSSSSHSMIICNAAEEHVQDYPPSDGDRYDYSTGWVAASDTEKRHYLAGLLVAQSPRLWGKGVLHDRNAEILPLPTERAPDWDETPDSGFHWSNAVRLPEWIRREIVTLSGLPDTTDISRHWSESSLGGNPEIPRLQSGVGPDLVAWAALSALILDPSIVMLAAEENSWDELQGEYIERPLEDLQTIMDAAQHG